MSLIDVLNVKLGVKTKPDLSNVSGSAVVVPKDSLKQILTLLKTEPELDFSFLIDLFGIDYMTHPNRDGRGRFAVVYNLFSLKHNHRLSVKVFTEDRDPHLPSACDLWPAADWYEREVWDMFGIRFDGHPDLKRLLMYEEFVGHPLRKDYPVDRRQSLVEERHEKRA